MKNLVFSFWILLSASCFAVDLDLPDANVDHWGLTGTDKVNAALNALDAGKLEWRGSVTEAERDALSSPTVGDLIYNSTAGEFEAYDGSAWGVMGGAMTGAELETVLDTYFGNTDWRTQDGYEANTDGQTLSFDGSNVSISGGNSVDVSSLSDGTGTDDQVASEVDFTPDGSIEATDVQAAIVEVRDETLGTDEVDSVNLEYSASTSAGDPLENDNSYSGPILSGLNGGETIAQWEVVYFDGTAGEFMLADADGTGTRLAKGLAVAATTDGNPISIISYGFIRNDAWTWTAGDRLYLSTAAGALTATEPSTSGDTSHEIGWAIDADRIFVDFSKPEFTVK